MSTVKIKRGRSHGEVLGVTVEVIARGKSGNPMYGFHMPDGSVFAAHPRGSDGYFFVKHAKAQGEQLV